jgi:hypothetical protein
MRETWRMIEQVYDDVELMTEESMMLAEAELLRARVVAEVELILLGPVKSLLRRRRGQ